MGGRIQRWPWRILPPSIPTLYNPLSLSVSRSCEYDRIVAPTLKLCHIRLHLNRLEILSAGFEEVTFQVIVGPKGGL